MVDRSILLFYSITKHVSLMQDVGYSSIQGRVYSSVGSWVFSVRIVCFPFSSIVAFGVRVFLVACAIFYAVFSVLPVFFLPMPSCVVLFASCVGCVV